MKGIKHWLSQSIVPGIKKVNEMKKMILLFVMQAFFGFVLAGFIYLFVGFLYACIALFFLLLMLMIKPVCLVLYKVILKTNWCRKQVDNELKFIRRISCELDVCNLGSNSGRYAFSYSDTGLKGENWALGPQTLAYDFRVLKNYHSYLKEGATVLIPVCPLSSCIIDFEEDSNNFKYYSFLHPGYILNFSKATKLKLIRKAETVYHVTFFRVVLKRLVKNLMGMERKSMSDQKLEFDANRWINNWKKQFEIEDMDGLVSKKNLETIGSNTDLLRNMIVFCLERNLKPVIVLPPVTSALSSKFPAVFRENYIYSFIRNANTYQIPFLNYMDDEFLSDPALYFNSYFLNVKGRKLFSQTILRDLHLVI